MDNSLIIKHHQYNFTSVLLGAPGGKGGEPGHEEMEAGERHHVDSQFTKVGVQLTREPVLEAIIIKNRLGAIHIEIKNPKIQKKTLALLSPHQLASSLSIYAMFIFNYYLA